jgi:non-specific serine/threonine protein kinase
VESLEPGSRLGHYRVLRKVGAGGMGEVYRCEDLRLERVVAVKTLTPEAAGDPARVQRFLREAKLASSLSHPNIVTVHGIEESDGLLYLVMEFVEGEDLHGRLARGPLPLAEALRLGGEVADALEAAHRAGLIHRDIKSSNILITPDGRAKVADFGLAKRLPTPSAADPNATVAASLTAAGAVVGTASYMSPEQTRGETLDARTDIFSLGVVLYEAATGRRPFEGPTVLSLMHEIAVVEPPAPSRARPGLPRALDTILLRAIAKERDRRYASAAEFAAALRELASAESLASATGSSAGAAAGPRRDEPTEPSAGGPAGRAKSGTDLRVPNNLPPSTTSFVGRRDDMEEVGRLLASAPLVTLMGAGGCGKSRLALQIARNLLQGYADGAWLVALAPLADPSLVTPRVAAIFDVREEPNRPLLETLVDRLAGRRLLLVLDNAEHLAAACGQVAAAIVAGCPQVRVLVTSRVALGVAGETLWRVSPLPTPDTARHTTLSRAEIARYESVRLFSDRAAAVHAGFTLTEENARPVAQICARLDGIPLALELAAARVKVLPARQILERLEDRFRLLTSGGAGSLPHQQTLRATVDWSYEILTEPERLLFDRLSVFAGGAALEAVESIAADDRLPEAGILDLVARLVDQSLLVPEEGVSGAARYRMLETLRDYGAERLLAAGERERLRGRHAEHFLVVAEGAERLLRGPEQARWLEVLEEDHDNLRHAIDCAVETRSVEKALRLCGALWRFWMVRGYFAEGRARFQAALNLPAGGASPTVHAKAMRGAAALARGQSDFGGARSLLLRSLDMARDADPAGQADALLELGNLADTQGEHADARRHYEAALAIRRARGERDAVAGLLHNLGVVTQAEGDLARAAALYEESLAINRDLGNQSWEAASLNALASVHLERGDFDGAARRHEESLAIHERLRDKGGIAYTKHELGRLAALAGDRTKARASLRAGLALFVELGDQLGVAETWEYFALLFATEHDDERALLLEGAAGSLRERLGTPATDFDRAILEERLAPPRERCGPERAAQLHGQGRLLDAERANRLAIVSGSD